MSTSAEWKHLTASARVPMYRSGWIGIWDAVRAAWKGEDRFVIPTTVCFGVWVKSDVPVEARITGAQVSQIPTIEAQEKK